MQSYHSNRRETERTKRRAQRSSSSGGSVHNIRDASESTVFQQRARVRVLGGWWQAQPTDGQETALQPHVASAATNVWSELDPRDADANESWTALKALIFSIGLYSKVYFV